MVSGSRRVQNKKMHQKLGKVVYKTTTQFIWLKKSVLIINGFYFENLT